MRGARVTGIDISESCCEIYREKFPYCEIICKSFLDPTILEYKERFDLILTDSIHHLNPHIDEGMEQVYRLLKPGGYFCCWEPSSGSLLDLIRKVWYRLDRTYFLQNEVSIDINSLFDSAKFRFEKLKTIYGGNVAYVLVNLSMPLRIPVRMVNIYAPLMIKLERLSQPIQCRLLSAWVLCLVKKRDDI
jgi:SAM-dependent methyltransferase